MKTKSLLLALAALVTIGFFACKKEAGTSTLNVRLTDAPGNWQQVNIDLKEVHVKFDNDTMAWQTLETKPGIYNLLGLQNGIDSLVGQGSFPQGQTVKEIRLVVGSNNTIMVDSTLYPLTIPSGAESGLKIKVGKTLATNRETVVVDFDAGMSIQQEADGYKLRPVIRVK